MDMLPEVTYEAYAMRGGTLGEKDFPASLKTATCFVRSVIGANEPQDEQDAEQYVDAVCAAIAVDEAYGCSGGIGEGMVAMSVGSFSATFGSVSMQSAFQPSPYERDMTKAVSRALSGSSLLYQGIA